MMQAAPKIDIGEIVLHHTADVRGLVAGALADLAVRPAPRPRVLGHVGPVDLPEDRLQVDAVLLSRPVDDVQEVSQGVGHPDQVVGLGRIAELRELLLYQERSQSVHVGSGDRGPGVAHQAKALVELVHHLLLLVHVPSLGTARIGITILRSPRMPSVSLGRGPSPPGPRPARRAPRA